MPDCLDKQDNTLLVYSTLASGWCLTLAGSRPPSHTQEQEKRTWSTSQNIIEMRYNDCINWESSCNYYCTLKLAEKNAKVLSKGVNTHSHNWFNWWTTNEEIAQWSFSKDISYIASLIFIKSFQR